MYLLPPDDPISAASEAVRELKEALAILDITLPSLGIDLASCASIAESRPLVELGRCNLATAHRLAAVLRQAAQ